MAKNKTKKVAVTWTASNAISVVQEGYVIFEKVFDDDPCTEDIDDFEQLFNKLLPIIQEWAE